MGKFCTSCGTALNEVAKFCTKCPEALAIVIIGGAAEAFRISINMGPEALGKLYGYLFGALFGDVPFATEAKSPSVDPPYLSE